MATRKKQKMNDWTVEEWLGLMEGKEELNLRGKKIEAKGAKNLAKALKTTKTVKMLNLSCNNIGDKGAQAIAISLLTNNTLSVLDLDGNNIGVAGAQAIATSLLTNNTLFEFNLYENNIGVEGAEAIATSLLTNNTLSILRLQRNSVGVAGAQAIATSLLTNNTLSILNLGENNIGVEGAEAIATSLLTNNTLSYLGGVDLNKYLHIFSLPDEFSNKDNISILAYLKELKKSSQATPTTIYRMRIMIVGPGDAGKTTLVHRILTGEFAPQQFSMTDGISMKEWKPEEKKNIQLSLWDFGGQEVYLNSHPMLFSDQSLYLLVWNPRVGSTVAQLEDYVLNIRSKSKSSPIMLVTTHSIEVDGREYENCLHGLEKYNYVSHHALDSSTGEGIEQLKSKIIELVTSEEEVLQPELESWSESKSNYSQASAPIIGSAGEVVGRLRSRVLIPPWYLLVESKLKELSREGGRFSIDREEFLSICLFSWTPSDFDQKKKNKKKSKTSQNASSCVTKDNKKNSNVKSSDKERMKTVMYLFHHWGIIYLLPNHNNNNNSNTNPADGDGDIVLNPQQLADVFKCVITASNKITNTNNLTKKQLFEKGILNHNILESVWIDYDPRLHSQFLRLLHDCELAYELFDGNGESTGQSLVPSLLPELKPSLAGMKEIELRQRMFGVWERQFPSQHQNQSQSNPTPRTIMSRGFVKITFDCLLPNFFSKLIIRLRHMHSSSVADCSRRHCVIHVPERLNGIQVGWSLCCVVEDRITNSLIVYPGGSSIDATSITHQAIRGLLDESFSGMNLKEVEMLVGQSRSLRSDIVDYLKNPVVSSNYSETEIVLMKSVGCLFVELDKKLPQTQSPADVVDLTSLTLPSNHIQTLSTLLFMTNQYERSKDVNNRFLMSRSLIQSIPIFREYGLNLSRHPHILWLVGRSMVQSGNYNKDKENYHLLGVSPNRIPTEPWEIVVRKSNISLPSESQHNSHHQQDLSSLSELLLSSLRLLLPIDGLPSSPPSSSSEPIEWIGLKNLESQSTYISELESNLFVQDKDMIGMPVYYSKQFSFLDEKQNFLYVSYGNEVTEVDINELKNVINENLIEFQFGAKIDKAVSIQQLQQSSINLRDVVLLQIAMTTDSRIDDSLKKQILFGLLLTRGLVVVIEEEKIVAPQLETKIRITAAGMIQFKRAPLPTPLPPAPDLSFFCEQKTRCQQPIWKMIALILKELKSSEDSLKDLFRLKSYASVMNKLFYRGKGLSDLFATTATTHDLLETPMRKMEEKGGVLVERAQNGNGCEVLKYVRLMEVTIYHEGDYAVDVFMFPVFYEIVYKTRGERASHEQYELDRLKFALKDEDKRLLERNGFTLEKVRECEEKGVN